MHIHTRKGKEHTLLSLLMPLLSFLFLSGGLAVVVFEVAVFLEEVHSIFSLLSLVLYVVVVVQCSDICR
jgi:hypothetical protein